MLSPTLDTFRLFLHVLAACIWVGGQFVLVGAVPLLRPLGSEATKAAANGFARVAWPAYGVLWATGIWNVLALPGSASIEYNATLGIKVLLVLASGFSAFFHAKSSNVGVKAATGAFGAVAALVTLYLGLLLTNGA